MGARYFLDRRVVLDVQLLTVRSVQIGTAVWVIMYHRCQHGSVISRPWKDILKFRESFLLSPLFPLIPLYNIHGCTLESPSSNTWQLA